jgi:hypothetical protein
MNPNLMHHPGGNLDIQSQAVLFKKSSWLALVNPGFCGQGFSPNASSQSFRQWDHSLLAFGVVPERHSDDPGELEGSRKGGRGANEGPIVFLDHAVFEF